MKSIGPFLLTLEMDATSFDRLDGWRRRYFPPERNIVPVHLSLFHQLPPTEETVVILTELTPDPMPLSFERLNRWPAGFSVQVSSPALLEVQRQLAVKFRGVLIAQDRERYRPHVTLMNKASADAAQRSYEELSQTFQPWGGQGTGLLLWEYLGGPWRLVQRFASESRG